MVEVPSGMPAKWEDILAMFHDGTTKLPDRNAVAGPGSKPWIVHVVNGAWHSGTAADRADEWNLDGYYAFSFPDRLDNTSLLFGFRYNWTDFGNDGGALAEFTGAAGPIFESVVFGKNKDANPELTGKAATILNNMDDWTDGWATQFNTWAESVGNGDEGLKGESAELFEATLRAVKRSLQETYSYYLNGELQRQLEAVNKQLTTTIGVLRNNAWNWFGKKETVGGTTIEAREAGPVSMAFTHLYASFLKTMSTQNPLSDHDPTKSGPDWAAIESRAKQGWITGVEEGLDQASSQTMTDLANAYGSATMKFSDANAIVKPTFTISLTADEQKDFYGSAGPGGGGAPGGANDVLNTFMEMFGGAGAGGGGTGGGAGTDGSGKDIDLSTPPPVTGPSGSVSGTNLPSGVNLPNTKNLLAQNPVTGPSGSTSGTGPGPVALPAGSRIDPKTGAVTDARGKPVTGPNGQPLVVPPGSTLGPGGKIIPPVPSVPKGPTLPSGSTSGDLTNGIRVDSNGNIIVPKGVKVDAQGNLIGADGKPLTNAYGGKLTVPPGSRVNADGTITDPQGKQITQASNSLKTRNPMTLDDLVNTQRRPSTSSGDIFGVSKGGSNDLLGGSKGVSDGMRKSLDGHGVTGREAIGGSGGISNRARAAMGLPVVPAAPTQGTLSTQSVSALGRTGALGTTGSGMPFMPPMGMGGGAPGGGGSGNDRQPNVWLSEDEEVWGTESDAGTGVIGR
ncbi:hypothetical protein [Streptomyces sp. V2I9]|uniref:hypothetical protein n=1 Tax=Streptomyces sp. V2I9 TaxID=3042304 RepID=UPI00277DCB7F|nr:hypothetical protein [Streptomyces sp. V2I9]MDQ0984512.1 hypothetical protein [Streptomyces sp. V2I9]